MERINFKKKFAEGREAAANSREFAVYQEVRDAVLAMLDYTMPDTAPSDYWKQELEGFIYMLDASPFIVEKLRHHTYHLTGLYEYFYRSHHNYAAESLRKKLEVLKNLDKSCLLVPEHPAFGGFGYRFEDVLYNLDTLKFYEFLIGLDRAGFIEKFKTGGKNVVLEIGSGWGGFAYQFKTLFPQSSYILVDFPQSFLFSATYLQILFPNARIYIGDGNLDSYRALEFTAYDFVFIPHYAWASLRPQHVDLAINMASFQEMTDAQVRSYVHQLAKWKTPYLYSLNRDISPNNREISGVTNIIAERYIVAEQPVLAVPYHTLSLPEPSLKRDIKDIVKNI